MSKKRLHRTQESSSAGTTQEPSLESRISEIATTTSRQLQKHWKGLTAFAVVVVACIGVYQVVTAVGETRETGLVSRLYELTKPDPPSDPILGAQESSDELPDIEGLEQLMADAENARCEAMVLKLGADYLAAKAESAASTLLELSDKPADDAEATARRARVSANRATLLAAIERIVSRAQERFPDDPDIKHWIETTRKWAQESARNDWLPPKRTYQLHLGATGAAAPSDAQLPKTPSEEPEPAGESETPDAGSE